MPRAEMHWTSPGFHPIQLRTNPAGLPTVQGAVRAGWLRNKPEPRQHSHNQGRPNGLVWVIEKLGGSAPSITHIPGPTDDAEPAG